MARVPTMTIRVVTNVLLSLIKLFNSLSLSIKQVTYDLNKFKHKLEKFLILNSFYSVEEYLDRDNKFEPGVPQ
jgi:hypothetical protein